MNSSGAEPDSGTDAPNQPTGSRVSPSGSDPTPHLSALLRGRGNGYGEGGRPGGRVARSGINKAPSPRPSRPPNGLEMSRPASAWNLSQTGLAVAGRVGSIELLGAPIGTHPGQGWSLGRRCSRSPVL